jgi:hypothetical protein
MTMQLELWQAQQARWPRSGRHVLAQYDEAGVVVYQAYRPAIGLPAAATGRFGAGFRLDRMTWIKPNFLWMMYRSGWGTKEDQAVVLAITLDRRFFDRLLALAVPSTYDGERFASEKQWQVAVQTSSVRVQWDPDHGPDGRRVVRRALQLGLRGEVAEQYARGEGVRSIDDVSDLVAEQRALRSPGLAAQLRTPREDVYPVPAEAAAQLGIGPTSA